MLGVDYQKPGTTIQYQKLGDGYQILSNHN